MNRPGSTVNGLTLRATCSSSSDGPLRKSTSNTPLPGSSGPHEMKARRWGSRVTGGGDGAAMEKNTPVRSIRVDGPSTWRIWNDSTNSADTISIVRDGSGRRSGGRPGRGR